MKTIKTLKRALLLGLCLAMLAGAALAEDVVNLSGEGCDSLTWECTLPDGRFILAGCRSEPGHYMRSRARLLCMNPDGTVSWDYYDPAIGACSFRDAVLTTDGRICAVLEDEPNDETVARSLKFFNLDGQPAGEEIRLESSLEYDYLLTAVGWIERRSDIYTDDLPVYYTAMTGWDGKELFRVDSGLQIWEGKPWTAAAVAEEDGVVLVGRETLMYSDAAAKIMKVDYQGNVIWENVLPLDTDTGSGCLEQIMKLNGGGYLSILWGTEKVSLVRFSPTGRLLWKNDEIFENAYPLFGAAKCGGRYVMQCMPGDTDPDGYHRYLWFDADGSVLGTTEKTLRREEVSLLKKKKKESFSADQLIFAGDCLWQVYNYRVGSNDLEKEMGSCDVFMVKIPVL